MSGIEERNLNRERFIIGRGARGKERKYSHWHAKMETEIGPKKCLHCDRDFMRSEICNRHIREKHPDKVFAAKNQTVIMT